MRWTSSYGDELVSNIKLSLLSNIKTGLVRNIKIAYLWVIRLPISSFIEVAYFTL